MVDHPDAPESVAKPQGPGTPPPEEDLGVAGRVTQAFINSPLSPLLFMAMLFTGLLGLAVTPRQEDPQISVPMVDVFLQYPGASAAQVASLTIEPLERLMSEIPGVEHVYSASQRAQGIVTVQFFVGEDLGPSIVKVHDKIQSNMDKMPPGVMPPLVKPKGIDDVPVVTLTLWSRDVDDSALRKLALDVLQSLKEIPNTGQGFIVGGRADQVRVEVFPERLSGFGISADQVANTIRTANAEQRAGDVEAADTHFNVVTGAFLRTPDDISRLVVGSRNDAPVYVRDVARVTQEPEDTSQLVEYYTAPAGKHHEEANGVPAVTIALAKKEGTNGVEVANAILARMEVLKGILIPDNVQAAVTRNYGETANDKVNELIAKLFKATGFVFILVLIAFRALRPALVVLLVIPVVILFTVFCAYLMGYTVDRVSLFALIFSIGILVDDAIVVVENIYRRWLEEGTTTSAIAVDAVREVGNPTIIATFTVVAALLPMGFVTGMMGPYMEPIPALGSVAMIFSLFAAFMFTPWWAMRLKPSMSYLHKAEKREHESSEKLERFFRRVLTPLIRSRGKRLLFRLVLWGSLIFALLMFYTTWVTVKMLPLDNKPEFSVVINMPEGTALPVTANLTRRLAEMVRDQIPEVTALQTYIGTARPFDFNGMVRHYYLRSKPWQAEIQVQLTHKTKRHLTSHELAVQARALLTEPARAAGARVAVVEMPPGPPVLQTVVAEIHGRDQDIRRQFATDMTEIFERAENLGDVDNYLEEPYFYWRFEVDTEKAVRRGISVDTINRNLAMAMGNFSLGDIKTGRTLEPINIVIQVPLALRAQINRLVDLPIPTAAGATVPLAELGRFVRVPEDFTIFHKDLRAVEYVTAESVGRLAAPIYGMLQVEKMLETYISPDGRTVSGEFMGPPEADTGSGFEWGGEWTVTYETFRDLGLAFAAALVLIYILVVWEFGNFRVPALIMAPIPLTLLGIIPGHWLLGAEFTATSMIGWIALAGIIVRNSILLVDFSIHAIRKGVSVEESVIQACKTRTRPIMITALALVAGSSVILTDPIFKGMAISLAFGVMVSTVLTLIVIPLACISASSSLKDLAFAGTGGPPAPAPAERPSVEPGAPVGRGSTLGARTAAVLSGAWFVVTGIVRLLWYGLTQLAQGLGKRVRPHQGALARSAMAPSPAGQAPKEQQEHHPVAAVPSTAPAAEVEAEQEEDAAEPMPSRPAGPPRPSTARGAVRPARRPEPRSPEAPERPAGKPSADAPGVAPVRPPPAPAAPRPAETASSDAIPETPRPPAGSGPVGLVTGGVITPRKATSLRKRRGIRLKEDVPGLDDDPADAEQR
jgi:multidrug efflux pump subunit AcrB